MSMTRIVAALAALPLIGAAPPQVTPGAAVECKLSYADAGKAVTALNVARSKGEDPEAEGGVNLYYKAEGVTVLGSPASGYAVSEFVAEGVHRKLFRADLSTPYPQARAAMLKLHGKTSCDAHEGLTAGERDCMIHVREDAGNPGRDVDMAMFELEGAVAVACIYTQK